MDYKIITDATADMSDEMLKEISKVEVIPMDVVVGENCYQYGPRASITTYEFYELQKKGQYAATSQISPARYCDHWRPFLDDGMDILYLCFSSGMSGTLQSSLIAADICSEEYPDRQILIVDTCGASVGEGLLVLEAARRQSSGLSIGELYDWINSLKMDVCHRFTVDQFDHLQHGGRVSAAAAAVGTMLQIKPMLRVDEQGKLVVIQKPRGRKKAISALVSQMEAGWRPEISKTVIVGHGGNPEIAHELYDSVAARFPEAEVYMSEIGPVIGAHTGPDMLALTYWGSNR